MYPIMSAFPVEFLTAHILICSMQPILGAMLVIPAGNMLCWDCSSGFNLSCFPLASIPSLFRCVLLAVLGLLHKGSKEGQAVRSTRLTSAELWLLPNRGLA